MNGGANVDDWSGKLSSIYETPTMTRWRVFVREHLAAAQGDRVLDAGCGPGYVAEALAGDVGPEGQVLGVGASEQLLAAAAERCADRGNVAFERGDVVSLPVASATVDAAVGAHSYEYVPDLVAAFADLYRVLRPGGRAVVCDTDWHSLTWNVADEERLDRIVRAIDAFCPHPTLAHTLKPRLEVAGFDVVDAGVYTHFETTPRSDVTSGPILELVAAVARAEIDDEEVDEFVADVEARADDGEHFFSLNQYLFVAEKPAHP